MVWGGHARLADFCRSTLSLPQRSLCAQAGEREKESARGFTFSFEIPVGAQTGTCSEATESPPTSISMEDENAPIVRLLNNQAQFSIYVSSLSTTFSTAINFIDILTAYCQSKFMTACFTISLSFRSANGLFSVTPVSRISQENCQLFSQKGNVTKLTHKLNIIFHSLSAFKYRLFCSRNMLLHLGCSAENS